MALLFVMQRAPEGNVGLLPSQDYVGNLRFIADNIEKMTQDAPYYFVQVDENYAFSIFAFESLEGLPEGFPEDAKEVMREQLERFEKDES